MHHKTAASSLLIRCFQCIKTKEEKCCSTIFIKSGVNRMWILKNASSLLPTIKTNNLQKLDCISTCDFSTLYTTIAQDLLKCRICTLISKSFSHRNNNYINVPCNRTFFSSFEPYKRTWLYHMNINIIYHLTQNPFSVCR